MIESMDLRTRVSEELLPFVQQPGQYIGGEWNQLVGHGDWQRARVRVALAFPDTYTIGMSHLGGQILYWLCNHTPGVCAERVYAPWLDAERRMREHAIPLFTWDTRQPVDSADLLAVSLQYEQSFTNLLMMLDLAGIPLRSADRGEGDPVVIAGGPQADNPEPMAAFLDLVVIGDGEVSMAALLDLWQEVRGQGGGRWEFLIEAARRFPWVYVPALYEVDYHPDGTVAGLRASSRCPAGLVPRMLIERCQTPDFENAPFPTRPLVPFVQVVHDRISIEIMRGCPQRCRFCHAGYTKRPLRWRPPEKILELAEETWRNTGHEEIGLLSLSTADYPRLGPLAGLMNERFSPRHVNLSMPSLRVDKMLAHIPWMVSAVRKSGLTIAAEAARDDMRAAIRKKVTDGNLFDGLRAAYRADYNSVKLYFMCGFPGETEDDIRGIFELARQVSLLKKEVRGGPAAVNASVGWLVPKPHTPMQWSAQRDADYFHEARRLLKRTAAQVRSAVRVSTHHIERSVLEGVLSRGDRKLADVIEAAYRQGARMDGWDECFRYDTWQRAFEQTGIDPAFYAQRERPMSEHLPWAHIFSGQTTEILQKEHDGMAATLGDRLAAASADHG